VLPGSRPRAPGGIFPDHPPSISDSTGQVAQGNPTLPNQRNVPHRLSAYSLLRAAPCTPVHPCRSRSKLIRAPAPGSPGVGGDGPLDTLTSWRLGRTDRRVAPLRLKGMPVDHLPADEADLNNGAVHVVGSHNLPGGQVVRGNSA